MADQKERKSHKEKRSPGSNDLWKRRKKDRNATKGKQVFDPESKSWVRTTGTNQPNSSSGQDSI